ncbi:MAG: UDP-3-O-[3-hydroxymyristoyl] N-acetylglucosamine deacetylase [Synergistaceae bacterium]|nr:UDP-3-O-[3-hydroxymyristoyl] N-acetylglucosamine deacetylase [Synergistaceae bacterium]
MMPFRRLLRPVTFSGRGLHTGEDATVTLTPRNEGGPVIQGQDGCCSLYSCSTSASGRGTDLLLPGGGRIKTTEHLFAALSGLGIHEVRVGLSGPEIPALDGCSRTFAEELLKVSEPLEDGKHPTPFALAYPVTVEDEERGSFLGAFPSRNLRITCVLQYPEKPIGTQMAEFSPGRDDFLRDIAPARTFALKSEIEFLRERRLARGGSLDNAILVGSESVQASGGLRFPDEFVRHKILDLLGDLYLLGRPLRAQIIAIRSGHGLHCRLVERLKSLIRKDNLSNVKETRHA